MSDTRSAGRGKGIEQLLRTADSEFALSSAGVPSSARSERSAPRRGAEARPPPIALHCPSSGLAEESVRRAGVPWPGDLHRERAGLRSAGWRSLRHPADWGVTAVSQRLLEHWRYHEFVGPQPFFCQIEAVETIIWLTEVAPRRAASKGLLDQIAKANEEANPELFRLAMKMATGSGKTTAMTMLIAWQQVNAARKDSKDFSRAFLIVTPGITIKDRLRVLLPSEPNNYYETREIAPPDMLPEVRRAEIVITNYYAFQHRETLALPKVARSILQGNDPEPLKTTKTDAEMQERACGKLLNYDRVNVINDKAHHCYRRKSATMPRAR